MTTSRRPNTCSIQQLRRVTTRPSEIQRDLDAGVRPASCDHGRDLDTGPVDKHPTFLLTSKTTCWKYLTKRQRSTSWCKATVTIMVTDRPTVLETSPQVETLDTELCSTTGRGSRTKLVLEQIAHCVLVNSWPHVTNKNRRRKHKQRR